MDIEKKVIDLAKIISTLLILLILAANALLLTKHCRKSQFFFSPKNMTIISLAVGDILFALFPMVVFTSKLFDLRILHNCTLNLTSKTYSENLIHFVYGVGLIVLGAEIKLRHRYQYWLYSYRPLVSVSASCIPWFLGAIIVLPLCLTKFGPEICVPLHSIVTITSVSVFLPASLALISSIAILFLHRQQNSCDEVTEPSVAFTYNIPSIQGSGEQLKKDANNDRYHQEQHTSIPNEQREPLFSETIQPQQQRRVVFFEPHHNEPRNLDFVYFSHSNVNREKIRLVVISFVYVLAVLPYSIHQIYKRKGGIIDDDVQGIVKLIVYLLMPARSCITPLIFTFFRV